ncbi:E3 ubiquitin-protein ligase msl-2 [Glossina fuscipes]|uniref:E3 ubiquitin-protein ligase msl-2 n=1 Tax=Glossina fuscipes TaxID=7396 RepID=A0A8U0WC30_9MUSC|nr:E3 ubiquitin-protein ligase msl-2 [Glossina fuscipes]
MSTHISVLAMNAVAVYVNAAKLVLQSTESNPTIPLNTVQDLCHILPHLRQLLSCAVCCHLINDPHVPRNGRCVHHVCRLCVRGQKNLQPFCNFCKDNRDFKAYDENKQMRCLLLCYKSMCEHLKSSYIFNQLAGRKLQQYTVLAPSVPLPQMTMQDLVTEGANYDEIINSCNSDSPKKGFIVSKMAPLPALLAPLSTTAITPLSQMQQNLNNTTLNQSTPKASTPPCNVNTTDQVPSNFKREVVSPPSKIQQQQQQQQHQNAQSTLAQSTSIAPPLQALTNTQPTLVQLNQLKNAPNITYIGPNTRGIVVPIVSSSATTTAPLTIASSRLQSLNRQWAQVRGLTIASTANSCATAPVVDSKPPLTAIKVSLTSTNSALRALAATTNSNSALVATATAVTATTTTQVRNPPPIKTVSNGSAMYSVLYTGIGNKITIKRKTDGDEDTNQKKNATTSTSTPAPSLVRPLAKSNPNKRRGCRCGNATPTPGKLTCCGQRCPCYVDSKSCVGCKCRGCRNPHRPGGGKVRPIIPELACYEIQMADDHSNPISAHDLPIATTTTNSESVSFPISANLPASLSLTATTNNKNSPTTNNSSSSNVNVTTTATLIPIRGCINSTAPPPLAPTTAHSMMQNTSFGSNATQASLTNNTANILQLDQLPRESVLIQNAEGKYQVVNLFTTTAHQAGQQVPSLQRIHGLSQAAQVTASNNFILPTTASTTSITTTTSSLPQIIIQSQQQTQHSLLQSTQRINNSNSNITAHSLPLQLQQQLKQNIITVHPISSSGNATISPASASILTPASSPASTHATGTLTLTPLIVSSQANNSYSTVVSAADVFTNSTDIIQQANVLNIPAVSTSISQSITHRQVVNSSTTNSAINSTTRPQNVLELLDATNM